MDTLLLQRIIAFLDGHPELKGTPPSDAVIAAAEQQLGILFHKAYKTFLHHFGGACAGIAIHGLVNGKALGRETVVELTLRNRQMAAAMGMFEALQVCYVIADDGSGNPIAIDPQGTVFLFDYDTGEIRTLAPTLDTLIQEHFVAF